MRRFSLIALFLSFAFFAGCSVDSQTGLPVPDSTPGATLVDYAKTWNVVIDGEFYATVTFDDTGKLVTNSDTSFMNGSVLPTNDGNTCVVTEQVRPPVITSSIDHYTVTFNGALSADRKTIYGLYTKNTGASITNGRWCATAAGNPYLTNADMVGSWSMSLDHGGYNYNITFGSSGLASGSNDATYISGSGAVEYTGGLGVVIRAQFVHTDPLGSTSTIYDIYSGTLDSLRATATGTYSSTLGSVTRHGLWTAAKIPAGAG